ncbi:ParB N-terminal domain-containing protein [Pumilibacter intestinalis]|uniref:ParB N-terminal domain-containing protein n=1 Tax=Pumilibacter intestinalis TaxID=2941511 RepID=UPI0030840E67
MQIEKKKVDDLRAAAYNPRKDLQPGDAEYEKLKRSILEFGYVEPVIWNKRTGIVVGGHQRLKVMKDLGYTEVDCVIVDLDESKEKALNIALNKISGEWNNDLLADLLRDLDGSGYDITLTGFDLAEAQELFGSGSMETSTKTILTRSRR